MTKINAAPVASVRATIVTCACGARGLASMWGPSGMCPKCVRLQAIKDARLDTDRLAREAAQAQAIDDAKQAQQAIEAAKGAETRRAKQAQQAIEAQAAQAQAAAYAASPQGKLESAKRFHILAAQAQAAARKTGNKDKIREANANEGEAFQELRNAEQGLADAQAQAIIDAQKRLTQATEACKARLLRDIREAQAVEQAQAKLAKERCVARLAADKLQPGRRGHKVGYYVPLRIAAAA
jgi:colicin import membrane protein